MPDPGSPPFAHARTLLAKTAFIHEAARADAPGSLRARLISECRRTPGISVAELQRRTACGWGAMYRDIDRMVRVRLLVRVQVGRRTLLYPTDAPASDARIVTDAALKGRTRRRIAETVARGAGVTAREVRIATNEPERTVYYHLAKLGEAGLVEARLRVRARVFFAAPPLVDLLR